MMKKTAKKQERPKPKKAITKVLVARDVVSDDFYKCIKSLDKKGVEPGLAAYITMGICAAIIDHVHGPEKLKKVLTELKLQEKS